MHIIKTIREMEARSRELKTENKTIGFVPTMGALHEGHLSLVRRSKNENDVTVVSIFVNPTQFGPNEDFHEYPKDTEGDLEKLSSLNVETVFMPDNNEMYPDGFSTSIDIGSIGEILCGASRPGHFNGVATVVEKLFNIVMPDRAYFGQKDFQQSVVIKKLAKECKFDTAIIVCPVIRESDGLAMSSRNAYLNKEERKSAIILNKTLQYGKELIVSGREYNTSSIKEKMETLIKSGSLAKIDYIEVVNPQNLETVNRITLPAVICLAVKIGNTRLIDNIIVEK
jgi:pantoate--beta-alanine ligase